MLRWIKKGPSQGQHIKFRLSVCDSCIFIEKADHEKAYHDQPSVPEVDMSVFELGTNIKNLEKELEEMRELQ